MAYQDLTKKALWYKENNKQKCKEYRQRRKEKILLYYGNGRAECACCGETSVEFLSLDHISGGGTKQRKELRIRDTCAMLIKQHLPPGYRILCHNCNQALGHYGYCPHNKELTMQI